MNLANHRTSIILAIVFATLLSSFWFFQDFAFIVFLSLLLQLLLQPVVDAMERRRIPRGLAAAGAILLFLLLVLVLLSILSRSVVPSLQRFVTELPSIGQGLQQMPLLTEMDLQQEMTGVLDKLRSVSAELLRTSLSFLLIAVGKIMDFVIIIFVSFYLLKDGNSIKRWLADLFPHGSRGRVLRLFDRLLRALRIYVCSQLVMCIITGLVVFTYFTIMHLPYASVFALLSGISEFVPVLGPTVASALGTVTTAATAWDITLQTALFYLALTQINHNVVYPALVGKSLHLHPVAVILGVVFGGHVPRRPLHRHRQDRHHRHLPRAADGDAGRGGKVNPYRPVIVGIQKQLLTHPSARWARLLKILGRYPMPSPLSRGRGGPRKRWKGHKKAAVRVTSRTAAFSL